jgi:hypothetical protein
MRCQANRGCRGSRLGLGLRARKSRRDPATIDHKGGSGGPSARRAAIAAHARTTCPAGMVSRAPPPVAGIGRLGRRSDDPLRVRNRPGGEWWIHRRGERCHSKPECEDLLWRLPWGTVGAIPVFLHCREPRAGQGRHFRTPNERVSYTKSTHSNVNGRGKEKTRPAGGESRESSGTGLPNPNRRQNLRATENPSSVEGEERGTSGRQGRGLQSCSGP